MANYWYPIFTGGGGASAVWTPQGVTMATVGGIASGTDLGTTQILDADTLELMFYPYTAPSVSMSSPAAAAIEFPLAEPTITITGTTVKHSNNITSATLKVSLNGAAYTTVYTEGAVVSTGQTMTLGWQPSDDFTFPMTQVSQVTTLDYSATAGDGTTTTSATARRQTYVYPFYYGVGAVGLTGAQVAALTKLVATVGSKTEAFAPTVEVYYFAYPASYASLTSIIDGNGFNITADWTLHNPVSITGADGTAQNYKVYEYNNLNSVSQNITFNF
jgi:hypothetical protein